MLQYLSQEQQQQESRVTSASGQPAVPSDVEVPNLWVSMDSGLQHYKIDAILFLAAWAKNKFSIYCRTRACFTRVTVVVPSYLIVELSGQYHCHRMRFNDMIVAIMLL